MAAGDKGSAGKSDGISGDTSRRDRVPAAKRFLCKALAILTIELQGKCIRKFKSM
ncbi:hypothetical protein DBIPINDM_004547 [Mesorhizobium sp. AR02]|uniref:hypothetical protein n=1 Tax=Mesorhizobium sp. AR02 TaxID=2865837 RepID=UPI002160C613|nr:hypothetical protein [Mesorhizobium sp. AR02]UVK51298.1 hypothetical protein DBIPINDM_004547 [Mesorhizobium sp. AR02]